MLNVFKLLAKGKRLRHTRFDPFGYTAERRLERQLIEDYQRLIERLVAELTPDNADALIEIAALPMSVGAMAISSWHPSTPTRRNWPAYWMLGAHRLPKSLPEAHPMVRAWARRRAATSL